jgi:hypothetical protein
MPSVSAKQHQFWEAIKHGWKPSGRAAPSVGVAKEFLSADKAEGKYQGKTTKSQQIGKQLGKL